MPPADPTPNKTHHRPPVTLTAAEAHLVRLLLKAVAPGQAEQYDSGVDIMDRADEFIALAEKVGLPRRFWADLVVEG